MANESTPAQDPQNEAQPVICTAQIVNRAGLHARPCHAIVSTALRVRAELRIRAGRSPRSVNGKSILELMTLEAAQGAELELSATGGDADALLAALAELIRGGFGEEC